MLEEILNCNTLIDKIILIKSCNDIYDVYDYRKMGIDEPIKIINPGKFAEKLGINIIFDKKQSIFIDGVLRNSNGYKEISLNTKINDEKIRCTLMTLLCSYILYPNSGNIVVDVTNNLIATSKDIKRRNIPKRTLFMVDSLLVPEEELNKIKDYFECDELCEIFKVNKYQMEENITEITGEVKKHSLFRKK